MCPRKNGALLNSFNRLWNSRLRRLRPSARQDTHFLQCTINDVIRIHHVVGEVLGADAIDIPLPSCRDWVEHEQPLFAQGGEELDPKEGVSAGLLVH